MKKVLSFVLVLTLVLGSFSVAFAAAPVDVQGTDWENAVAALSDLGVVNGYEDGSYKPENSVNRAEAAKLIISALGLSEYAAGITSTSFTDLDGFGWAVGYIGYAETLGILKGVGNGLYNPAGQVTYEQVCTMIVRAIGWTDESLAGTWPANYVVKAKSLGILDDISKAGASPANRGDVAIMIYNALECPMVAFDKDAMPYGTGDNMLNRLSNKDVVKDVLLTENVIKTNASGTAIASGYAKGVNLTAQYGAYVDVFVNKDAEITGVKATNSTFLKGEFKDINGAVKFIVDDTTYDVTSNLTIQEFLNGRMGDADGDASTTQAALAFGNHANYDGKTFTIAAKVDGKKIKEVYSVAKWNGTNIQWKTSDASKLSKKVIRANNFDTNNNKEIDTTTFTLVGADSLDKIPTDAIVTVYVGGAYITKVEVSTEKVEGKVTKTGTDADGAYFTINGSKYYVAAMTDGDTSDVKLGAEGTFVLNYAGDIVDFNGVTKADNYALVTVDAKEYNDGGFDPTSKYAIKLLTADGKNTKYEVKKSATLVVGNVVQGEVKDNVTTFEAIVADAIVAYHLNADGIIDRIEAPTMVAANSGTSTHVYTSKGFLNGVEVASNVVVFTGTAANDDQAVGSVANLKKDDPFGATTKYVLNAKGDQIVAILVGDADSNTTKPYGVVVDYADVENSDGDTVYEVVVLVDGAEKTYLTDTHTAATYGFDAAVNQEKVAEFTFDGEVITAVAPTTTAITTTVAGIKNGSIKLEGGTYAQLADDVVVYEYVTKADGTFDTWKVSDLDSIAIDIDYAALFDTDTTKGHEGYEIVVFVAN